MIKSFLIVISFLLTSLAVIFWIEFFFDARSELFHYELISRNHNETLNYLQQNPRQFLQERANMKLNNSLPTGYTNKDIEMCIAHPRCIVKRSLYSTTTFIQGEQATATAVVVDLIIK